MKSGDKMYKKHAVFFVEATARAEHEKLGKGLKKNVTGIGITVFPRIIAGGDYFYFRTKMGRLFEGRRLFEGGDYFKYFSQEVVR